MNNYVNFKAFSVRYDEAEKSFSILREGCGAVLSGVRITAYTKDLNNVFAEVPMDHFKNAVCSIEKHLNGNGLAVSFSGGDEALPFMTVRFSLDSFRVKMQLEANPDVQYLYSVTGRVLFGEDPENETLAMYSKEDGSFLRASLGPASSPFCDMLFDRKTDRALFFGEVERPNLFFDEKSNSYRFDMRFSGAEEKSFSLSYAEKVYENKYALHYAPAVKRGAYKRPPCGWMTWYAVQFAASETTVLENARVQREMLRDFGADTVWVDWEWYHGGFFITEEKCDTETPDSDKYPNGMKAVADKIKAEGLIPAIWIGASHEVRESAFIREHPESVLVHKSSWCGPYWFDPTDPAYLGEFLPRVFTRLKEWGYRAIKWDALPKALDYYDMYHDGFHEPEKSSEEAMRDVISLARKTVGEEIYMLSCHGEALRDTTMYADLFDAARIGADIFGWEEFKGNCIGRLYEFYPFHNVLQLLDPDNVVLREEFNNLTQARSRASFVSLAGTPITFGDDLTKLPEERMEVLRRTVPPLDIRTMELSRKKAEKDFSGVCLAIKTELEEYTVCDLFNMKTFPAKKTVTLRELMLPEGEYLAFEFWSRSFLGICREELALSFDACESKVISLRRKSGVPQLLSTSRHVTQGACELRALSWDPETLTLQGQSELVKGDPYRLFFYVPDEFIAVGEVLRKTADGLFTADLSAEENGVYPWSFSFRKK